MFEIQLDIKREYLFQMSILIRKIEVNRHYKELYCDLGVTLSIYLSINKL